MNNKFTEQDYNTFQDLTKFIIEHAKWDLATKDAVQLSKFLGFMNSINNKIKSNIFEVTQVVEPPKPKAKRPTKKAK